MRLKFKPNIGASRDSKQAGAGAGTGGGSVATGRDRRTTSSKQPKSGGVGTGSGKDSAGSVGKESGSEERERSVPSNSDQQRLSEEGGVPPGGSGAGETSERTRTSEGGVPPGGSDGETSERIRTREGGVPPGGSDGETSERIRTREGRVPPGVSSDDKASERIRTREGGVPPGVSSDDKASERIRTRKGGVPPKGSSDGETNGRTTCRTREGEQQGHAAEPTSGNSKGGCTSTSTEQGTAQEESTRAENRIGTQAEQSQCNTSPVGSDLNISKQQTINAGSHVARNTISSPSLPRDQSSSSSRGRGATARFTRKRVAPNLAAGRGRRTQQSSEGKPSQATAKPSLGSLLRESKMTRNVDVGTEPSAERRTQPSAQTGDKGRTDSVCPAAETPGEVSAASTTTIASKVSRPASNRALPSKTAAARTLPEEENTDEMISNTLNEVLEHAHSSDEFATPGGDNLSGIVRSSLDLLYPPPPLGHSVDEGSMELGGDTVRLGAEEEVGGASDVCDTSCVDGDSDVDGHEHNQSGVEDGQSPVPDTGTSTRPNKRPSETQNTSGSSKEPKAGAKRKGSPSSTAEAPEAKRNFRNAPDKSTMTMSELIYYNPSANPMGSSVEEKKQKRLQKVRAERAAVQHFFPQGQGGQQQDDTAERSSPPAAEEEEGGRIVPQLRIGADGNIVIDERSMVMDTTQTQSAENGSEPVLEHSGHTTSASFRKSYKVPRWTKEETTTFYKALSQVGTDFTMMTLLLPKRSRNELKNKFKKEEKKNPQRISEALESR